VTDQRRDLAPGLIAVTNVARQRNFQHTGWNRDKRNQEAGETTEEEEEQERKRKGEKETTH